MNVMRLDIVKIDERDLRRAYREGVRLGLDRPVVLLAIDDPRLIAKARACAVEQAEQRIAAAHRHGEYTDIYQVDHYELVEAKLGQECGEQWREATADLAASPDRFLAVVLHHWQGQTEVEMLVVPIDVEQEVTP
jgi:hypothetical protein